MQQLLRRLLCELLLILRLWQMRLQLHRVLRELLLMLLRQR
jgi:hypothetical protein